MYCPLLTANCYTDSHPIPVHPIRPNDEEPLQVPCPGNGLDVRRRRPEQVGDVNSSQGNNQAPEGKSPHLVFGRCGAQIKPNPDYKQEPLGYQGSRQRIPKPYSKAGSASGN